MPPKYNLEYCKNYIGNLGGECLSEAYLSSTKGKMKWKCSKGHETETRFAHIIEIKGEWCNTCRRIQKGQPEKRITIEECQLYAKNNGGEFLDNEYKGIVYNYNWRCGCGYEWKANLNNVIHKKQWCWLCRKKQAERNQLNPEGLKRCQRIAIERKGKLISIEYIGARHNHIWECHNEHQWSATPDNIRRGKWCPYCRLVNERKCRDILEKIFEAKFPKCRPKFLQTDKYKTGLELDGYNKDMKIAFEYDGEFHYKKVGGFNNNLEKQQERDKDKDQLCKQNGITLIRIPYYVDDKEEYICDLLS